MNRQYTEKFFIPQPTATGHAMRDRDGKTEHAEYKTADGRYLMWSGKFPLPEIGDRIWIDLNGIGWGEVKGYFEADGYLGVMTLAENPPEWLRKQHERRKGDPKQPEWMRQGIGCEFGAEIELTKEAN